MVAQSPLAYNLFFSKIQKSFLRKLTKQSLPDARLPRRAVLQRVNLFLIHLLVETVQHRSNNRRKSRAVNLTRQSAYEVRQTMPRRKVQNLLRHLNHTFHQRSAADQHHAGEYLLVKTSPLYLFQRMTENLFGSRLQDLAQNLTA